MTGQYGTYASGGWDLKPTSRPKPPKGYEYICTVGGSGSASVNGVDGSYTVSVTISCTSQPTW